MRIHIRNGQVIDPINGINAKTDIFVADGRIVAVDATPAHFSADRVIDAAGLIVCPGLIDISAHLREPGQEYKATIASETRAAAAAGITTVCCAPETTPVVDTPAVVELIHHRAAQAGHIRVVTLGALTDGLAGKQLSNMAALKDAGCVGVSNGRNHIANALVMRRAMEYAATFDLTVFLHVEDEMLKGDGCMHEGPVSTRLGLPGIPEAAETVAVARELALIEQTGVRAHFCRISTARAAQMIARAQHDGLPVTADVAAHQLFLTEMDVADFNSACHVQPPLRTQRDREGLLAALKKGTIGVITSDHQPHEADAKLNPFSQTEPGVAGLETLLPLGLRLVEDEHLDLPVLVMRLSCQPAKILGIEGGSLAIGARADICVFNPHAYWEVNPSQWHSQGRNTPFAGWELKGRASYTVAAGKIVFEQPEL